MRAAQLPVIRDGSKHLVAVVVTPDSAAPQVALVQQIFGPPMTSVSSAMGESDSPYSLILCGEGPPHGPLTGGDVCELAPLPTLRGADTVIVPGVENPVASRSEELLDALRGAAAAGARMVAFCAGAFLLGYAGLLDRRRATTNWLLADEFRATFPHVRLEVDRLYIDDGPVYTAGGIFSATDLVLHLVALDQGQAYASDLGRILVSASHTPVGQVQFDNEAQHIEEGLAMTGFVRWLREHIAEPLTLAQLAASQHVSERTLLRKFRNTTGMSVFSWIARERINQAKVLLETTDYRIGEVAAMVGFGSSESFRRNFEKIVGTTASAYRNCFRHGVTGQR